MLFGRKKEKAEQEFQEIQEIKLPTIEEIKKEIISKPQVSEEVKQVPLQLEEKGGEKVNLPEEKPEPEEKIKTEEIRKFVPVFVKLEKYEEILNTIAGVKGILNLLKDSFSIFEENERIRREAVEAIKENVEEIEKKISSLDSILLRPVEYEEKEFRAEEVKDTLSVLRSQIEKLKQELQSLK
jgi:histone H3/H4